MEKNKLLGSTFSLIVVSLFLSVSAFAQKSEYIALLNTKNPGLTLPRKNDARSVEKYLRELTTSYYNEFKKTAPTVTIKKAFWVNHTLLIEATPNEVQELKKSPLVTKIILNRKVGFERPTAGRYVQRNTDNEVYPYDFVEMKLDAVRAKRPELNGQGVIVGHIDTGADGNHPLLKNKFKLFYDASKKTFGFPIDTDRHGTHTAGTIAGSIFDGKEVGVAPAAQLFSIAGLGSYTDMIASMQIMLDPDGNPATADQPRLVSNSWNCNGATSEELELFYRAINAWVAAGITPVFSAGNSGPSAQSITKPHEHPLVIAVGATGKDGKIASFSSRGPSVYKGETTQKPDITAPGVEILSSVPGGKMAALNGTSMAAPHVSGLVALMLQAEPNLTPQLISKILIESADSVDENGNPQERKAWNANYGFGKTNALKALETVMRLNIDPSHNSRSAGASTGSNELNDLAFKTRMDRLLKPVLPADFLVNSASL